MCTALRSLSSGILLLASLSGQAATGMVLAHVATDHAVRDSHEEHGADHHAADHPGAPEREHRATDDGSEHTHQITAATAAAPARVTCSSVDVQPCLALLGQARFDRPAPSALVHLALPALRAGPPESQRHPILLL